MNSGPSVPFPNRPRGRPRRADAPIVDWLAVDRALVFGERVKDPITGIEAVKFPSLNTLGARYGVSRNRIWQYASKAKCYQRREEAQRRTRERYDDRVISQNAKARALATADVVGVVDAFIQGFEQALREDRIRCDSPADLDRMVRLKELLLGNADSRQEVEGGLTLSAIQERRRTLRLQLESSTPAITGAVVSASTGAGVSAQSGVQAEEEERELEAPALRTSSSCRRTESVDDDAVNIAVGAVTPDDEDSCASILDTRVASGEAQEADNDADF